MFLFLFFFVAQLAYKLARFYFRFQNDRTKNRSKLGCDVISRSHTSSLQSLEKDLTFFTAVVNNTKSQVDIKQDIFPCYVYQNVK